MQNFNFGSNPKPIGDFGVLSYSIFCSLHMNSSHLHTICRHSLKLKRFNHSNRKLCKILILNSNFFRSRRAKNFFFKIKINQAKLN